MRRVRLLALWFSPIVLFAQEKTSAAEPEPHGDPWFWWKLANFIILVGLLAFMIKKKGAGFFERRTEQIQASMREAERANRDAQERIVLMERKLAGLGDEIEHLRASIRHEMAEEGERIRIETERHINRIQAQAEQEIESMAKRARRELKLYAAGLAFDSAEQQLKQRVSKDLEDRLVSSFADGLRTRSSNN